MPTWSQERWSSNLKLTENETCVMANKKEMGIAYSKLIMKPNSGIFSGLFEITNPRNTYNFIGVALYGKIKKFHQRIFDNEWVVQLVLYT